MLSTYLITGGMFSGKSKRLTELMEEYILSKKKILFFTPKKDTRLNNSHNNFIENFLNQLLKSEWVTVKIVDSQKEILSIIKQTAVEAVFIDEYFMLDLDQQLFCQLNDFLNQKKINLKLYLAGLIADAESHLFPTAIKILPYIDYIEKRTAICMECGQPASYSFFDGQNFNPNQLNIDQGNYRCLCLNCYLEARSIN